MTAKSLLDAVKKLAGEPEFVHAWKCNRNDCSHYAMICSCRDDVKFPSSLFFFLSVPLDRSLEDGEKEYTFRVHLEAGVERREAEDDTTLQMKLRFPIVVSRR